MTQRVRILSVVVGVAALAAGEAYAQVELDPVTIIGNACTAYPWHVECGGPGYNSDPAPGDAEADQVFQSIAQAAPGWVERVLPRYEPPCIHTGEPRAVYFRRAHLNCVGWVREQLGFWVWNLYPGIGMAAEGGCSARVAEFFDVAANGDTCESALARSTGGLL